MIQVARTDIPGDLNGFMSPYLHRRRIAAVRPYLRGCRRILDIGCGVLRRQDLLPPDAEYVGVDCEESVIQHNRAHAAPFEFVVADVECDGLSACGKGFDAVVMLAVLEHLHDPQNVLAKLASLLNPDGIIAATVPHPAGETILNLGSRFRIFAQDKHQHHSMLDYEGLRRLANDAHYRLATYKRFLWGFNQLVIFRKATKYERVPA